MRPKRSTVASMRRSTSACCGDVTGEERRALAGAEVAQGLLAFVGVATVEDDAGPLGQERLARCRGRSPGATGDGGHPALELHGSPLVVPRTLLADPRLPSSAAGRRAAWHGPAFSAPGSAHVGPFAAVRETAPSISVWPDRGAHDWRSGHHGVPEAAGRGDAGVVDRAAPGVRSHRAAAPHRRLHVHPARRGRRHARGHRPAAAAVRGRAWAPRIGGDQVRHARRGQPGRRHDVPHVRARGPLLPRPRRPVSEGIPGCYEAEIELPGGDFVLLLEDLVGYRQGDQAAGCGVKDVELGIDVMARLHAAWWDAADHPELAWVPTVNGELHRGGMVPAAEASWAPFVAGFGHLVAPEILDAAPRYLAALPDLHARMAQGPQTLIHGDFRLDNLLFGTKPDHHALVLIDWQGVIVSKGAHDLGYLLSQNLVTDARRTHERELVQRYADCLRAAGVQGYSAEQAWDDYRLASLWLFEYAIIIGGFARPVQRARLGLHVQPDRAIVGDDHRPRPARAPALAVARSPGPAARWPGRSAGRASCSVSRSGARRGPGPRGRRSARR